MGAKTKCYREIIIFRNGQPVATTTQARNPKVARNIFSQEQGVPLKEVRAKYAPDSKETAR